LSAVRREHGGVPGLPRGEQPADDQAFRAILDLAIVASLPMEALFPIFIIGSIIGFALLMSFIQMASLRRVNRVITNGVPAKGLVLSVSQTGINVTMNGTRYERRGVVVDVEIPGQAPYQVSAQPLIPKNIVRNVLPGTFVELRVDPTRRNDIAVIGPGSVFFVK
jgi:hypothetical protein